LNIVIAVLYVEIVVLLLLWLGCGGWPAGTRTLITHYLIVFRP